MKHVRTIKYARPDYKSMCAVGCGECRTSCQSACKTSCTVGSQICENSSRSIR
ncbi:MAG: six-cysteine ranthipeptide SCIFF [Clostridiales bacterium]|nr:six-cysteine ranthipeptide SCIFF [Clostridiales bacterium]